FAYDPERTAGFEGDIDPIDRAQPAAWRVQIDRKPLDREERQACHHNTAERGSVSSRSLSPIMLNASTVRNIAPAGKNAIDGAVSRLSRPSAIMPPQLGVGGGTPRPKKLNAPSMTIITATTSRK